MAKICFGTVKEMFAELQERGITEARVEPIKKVTHVRRAGDSVRHQMMVTSLINELVAEVVIDYHNYIHITSEQVQEDQAEAIRKSEDLFLEIHGLAKDFGIKLRSGYFSEGDDSFIGLVRSSRSDYIGFCNGGNSHR